MNKDDKLEYSGMCMITVVSCAPMVGKFNSFLYLTSSHFRRENFMVFTDIVVDVQVIKLMNSILSPVTCGFSFLGILVQELDLHLVVKDNLVLIDHLGFMLI